MARQVLFSVLSVLCFCCAHATRSILDTGNHAVIAVDPSITAHSTRGPTTRPADELKGRRLTQEIPTAVPFLGDAIAIGHEIASLMSVSGYNIRNIRSPLGCLDGNFDGYTEYTVTLGSDSSTNNCQWGACPYTVGYWDTCAGDKQWQFWQMSGGHLWTKTSCFGAARCMDAPDVTSNTLSIACGISCWGGAHQEMYVDLSMQVKNSVSNEPLFRIRNRGDNNKCLAWIADNGIVYFEPCSDIERQYWFIPGVLPQP